MSDERELAQLDLSKRRLRIAAAVLMAVLIALLIWLWWLLRLNPEARLVDRTELGINVQLVLTGPGRGDKPKFERPMAVAWAPGGRRFYVADSENNRVCMFDDTGRFLGEFGGFGVAKPLPGAQDTWDPGELNYPIDLAVDDNGDVYVADHYNDSISVFSAQGRFIRRFPEPTKVVGHGASGQDGLGIAVTALAVHGDRVYAADAYQIVVFTRAGKLVAQFGKPGKGSGDFSRPNGIAVADDGLIVVADSNNSRVQAFDGPQRVVWTLGGDDASGLGQSLTLPRGITVVGKDRFLVADTIGQQLALISRDGDLVARLGTRGVEPAQVNFPNDVAWADGRILIADRDNNRVQMGRIVRQGE